MGLLDDAIREHLELKRRHGADAAEVARQEREALGPARRGPEPLEVPPAGDRSPSQEREPEPEPVDPALVEPEVEPPAYEEPRADAPVQEPPAAVPAPVEEPGEPEPAWHDPEPRRDEPEPAARHPEPEPEPERPQPEPRSTVDQPTVAFDAADLAEAGRGRARRPQDAPAGREGEEDEDVLEETPDFLQETPEHDRLWFEQRPPRDFDFDG